MYLHEDKRNFRTLVIKAAEEKGIDPTIVEKDYYTTLFLHSLTEETDLAVFKGGSSLSKCFGTIHRFSEDIDLNCENQKAKPTVGMRRELKEAIIDAARKIGLKLKSDVPEEKIPYRQDYNKYTFSYDTVFPDETSHPFVLVETSVRSPSFPTVVTKVDSILGKYLKEQGISGSEYTLNPFTIKAQSKERTFVDKLFAAADYYLADMQPGDSRHLYDLYCLKKDLTIDENIIKLMDEVREVRKDQPNNPAARNEKELTVLLREVLALDFYKRDYINATEKTLYEPVSYTTVKKGIEELLTEIEKVQASHKKKIYCETQEDLEKKLEISPRTTRTREDLSKIHKGNEKDVQR